MPEEIRLWRIEEDDRLVEYRRSGLDLESRLEVWLERDISILASNLLVIGRQVETAFGGIIDLLCMDEQGDLEIVELKRDKTPRDVTAQALDYASWVSGLSSDRIASIADAYLRDNGPLDPAFKRRFDQELPDSLNSAHNMIIVAAEIDSSSERIINYLSDSYGVGINAATFQYFRSPDGQEYLARTFLIEPSRVDYQARTRSGSKRVPNLRYEELEEIAFSNGVQELYSELVSRMTPVFLRGTTQSSIAFIESVDGGRKTVFSLIPQESSVEKGLRFQLYLERFANALQLTPEKVLDLLPEVREQWEYYAGADPEYTGYAGYFRTQNEVNRFAEGVETSRQAGTDSVDRVS